MKTLRTKSKIINFDKKSKFQKQKQKKENFFKLEIGPDFDWIRLWSHQKYQEKGENPQILIISIRGVVKSY